MRGCHDEPTTRQTERAQDGPQRTSIPSRLSCRRLQGYLQA
ncbi:hypothetical protein A7982_13563 [Minicystis rosea]|nr:hypothetical protein A7982_13563 [Minicystis rosea]